MISNYYHFQKALFVRLQWQSDARVNGTMNIVCLHYYSCSMLHLANIVCLYYCSCIMVHCEVTKKTNQMENLCLLSKIPRHISGIITPIFRRPRHVLLHVLCCAVTSGEKVEIICNVFFVGQFVVNLDVSSFVYTNVVCKWVCRGAGLVSALCVLQVFCIGSGCTDACVVPV